MSKGWISIHRKIQDSDLWNEKRVFSRLEAWLDILLVVNHESKEMIINDCKVTCGRGESALSHRTWAKRWRWSESHVRRYFKYLIFNDMISVTTRYRKWQIIRVLNYDFYQNSDARPDASPDAVNDATKLADNGLFNEIPTQRMTQDPTQDPTRNNKENKINNTSFFISLTKNQIFKIFKREGIEKSLIEVFLENRLAKRKPIHQKDIDDILSEIEKTELTPNEVFEIIARRNWAHFKSEWLKPKTNEKSKNNGSGNSSGQKNGVSRSERIKSESEERTARLMAELQGENAEKGTV